MLLAQIEGFVEIARQGNMRRAADALSISQPALTARLQGLEEELGASLFRRTHTGMVLTPAGRAFLPHADRAIEAIRSGGSLVRAARARRHRRARARGRAGGQRIRAAGDPRPLHGATPERAPARTDRPFGGDRRSRGSRRGRARDRQRAPRRASPQPCPVRGRAPSRRSAGPPVCRCGRVDVSEIRHAQLILFDRTSSYYDVTNALFRIAGVVPRGVTEVDNIEAAKRMVERGSASRSFPGRRSPTALSGGIAPRDRARRRCHDPAADRGGRTARCAPRVAVHRRRCGNSSSGSRSSSRGRCRSSRD